MATRHRRGIPALLLGALLSLAPSEAGAQCFPDANAPRLDDVYRYMNSFSTALSYAKDALSRVEDTKDDVDILVGLRRAKADFECAAGHIRPYVKSQTELIRESAEAASGALTSLSQVQDLKYQLLVKSLNEASVGTLRPGTAADAMARLVTASEEAGQMLVTATLAASFTLVALEPSTGTMSRLALTASERDALVKKLDSAFGPSIAAGPKAGQGRVTAAAAILYQVLTQPRAPKVSAP